MCVKLFSPFYSVLKFLVLLNVLKLQALFPQIFFSFFYLLLELSGGLFTVIEGGHPVAHRGQGEASKRHQQVDGHRPGDLPVRPRKAQVQQVEGD